VDIVNQAATRPPLPSMPSLTSIVDTSINKAATFDIGVNVNDNKFDVGVDVNDDNTVEGVNAARAAVRERFDFLSPVPDELSSN
jgi:hypothetical protein